MSSLRPKDRVSLCTFTFSDSRQCRTPRAPDHPHLCPHHARKQSQADSADQLASDLAFFFSGKYLSANDLAAALGRLLPAVVCGDIKPRTARTVAYLAQTLLQTIHLAQHEYINAYDTNAWRQSIRDSLTQNHDHLNANAAPASQPNANRVAPDFSPASGHSTSPKPSPEAASDSSQPSQEPASPSASHPNSARPKPHAVPSPTPPTPNQNPAPALPSTPQPKTCHSEQREESAFPPSSAGVSPASPATPSAST